MSERILVIGNKNYSSWSLRPWVWMTHAGLEFEERRVPLFTETTDSTLSPYFSDCKVPVLIDHGRTVWDSLAILEYLAEQYPHSHAWPADATARALARSASAEMHSSFFALRNELPMNCRASCPDFPVSADVRKDVDRIEAVWARCREQSTGRGPFLFGDFSAADAMYAPVVFRFNTYGVEVSAATNDYMQAMLSLPAMQAWKAAGEQESEVIEEEEVCP